MGKKGIIEDKEQLFKLAPVARAELRRHVSSVTENPAPRSATRDFKAAFQRELKKPEMESNKKNSGD